MSELLQLIQTAPGVLVEVVGLVLFVLGLVGMLGSYLESLGVRLALVWLERLGQRLEAIGADWPKLIRGSRYTTYIFAHAESMAEATMRWRDALKPPKLPSEEDGGAS